MDYMASFIQCVTSEVINSDISDRIADNEEVCLLGNCARYGVDFFGGSSLVVY